MSLNRWKSACAKTQVAKNGFCRYDTAVSGGGHRRLDHTGEKKCIGNLSRSHRRPLFLQAVTHSVKRLALVPALLQLGQRLWAAIPSQVQLLAGLQGMPAILATSVTNIHNDALTRISKISKGVPLSRGVPFCLPNA